MFFRIALRRAPRVVSMPVRFSSSVKEGSVAQSKGFKERESAVENEYVHKQEQAYLKKLKADIELKKAELEKLQKEHESVAEKK